MPDATKEQNDAFNEAQRVSASAECAVRYLDTVANFDVRDLLPQVKAPTLVMHVRDDRRVPIAAGRDLATGIPDARFVTLPGNNHIPLEQDPSVPILLDEVQWLITNTQHRKRASEFAAGSLSAQDRHFRAQAVAGDHAGGEHQQKNGQGPSHRCLIAETIGRSMPADGPALSWRTGAIVRHENDTAHAGRCNDSRV